MILPGRRIRIVRPGRNARGEILDLLDVVLGTQDRSKKRPHVEPLVGRALQGTVVEVKAVNVDERPHQRPPQKQKPVSCPTGLAAPRPKPWGERGRYDRAS